MECEVSNLIDSINSHGFQDSILIQAGEIIYDWAFEVIILEEGYTVLKAMTKFFRMAIITMNKAQFISGLLGTKCMRYCGFEILDILAKCFGGCLRCKEAMLNQRDFKYTP